MNSKKYYTTEDFVKYAERIRDCDVEHILIIMLKDKSIINVYEDIGNEKSVLLDYSELLKVLLEVRPDEIVSIHNHPCYDGYVASNGDNINFNFLFVISELLNIHLVDNIIVCKNNDKFWSQKDTDFDIPKTAYNTFFTEEGIKKLDAHMTITKIETKEPCSASSCIKYHPHYEIAMCVADCVRKELDKNGLL